MSSDLTLRVDCWTAQESAPLLKYLYEHAARPEFTTRFTWRVGSIAFWDNRATSHCALNDYHSERRLVHRMTIECVPLSGKCDGGVNGRWPSSPTRATIAPTKEATTARNGGAWGD